MGTLSLSTQQLQVLALIHAFGIWGSAKDDSRDPFEMAWLDTSLPQNPLHIGSVRALFKKGAVEAVENPERGDMEPDWLVHTTPAGNALLSERENQELIGRTVNSMEGRVGAWEMGRILLPAMTLRDIASQVKAKP